MAVVCFYYSKDSTIYWQVGRELRNGLGGICVICHTSTVRIVVLTTQYVKCYYL
ncbi:hypothetical protein EG68_12437 [Paragonimus skrjabini miyazakii]|uniref:Uncharacterized protein n=1 Tax=Paragonimus skrjabini miyazakii TaxID=59628 RepID=A0A8S9YFZ4_9TREM|nr:hypothetical protein EG68_12437 [Paragonimus skrjabini miyazakii]